MEKRLRLKPWCKFWTFEMLKKFYLFSIGGGTGLLSDDFIADEKVREFLTKEGFYK